MEFKMLKIYIKNNLINSFIRLSKFPIRVPIFFDKEPNGSLKLSWNYCNIKNLKIKYWYPLSLVKKSWD